MSKKKRWTRRISTYGHLVWKSPEPKGTYVSFLKKKGIYQVEITPKTREGKTVSFRLRSKALRFAKSWMKRHPYG